MMPNRRARNLIAALLGVVGALLTVGFVVLSIFEFRSFATGVQQWLYALLWGPIVVGILIALWVRFRRGRVSAAALPDLHEVNDLYLGNTSHMPNPPNVAAYSAYPPDPIRDSDAGAPNVPRDH